MKKVAGTDFIPGQAVSLIRLVEQSQAKPPRVSWTEPFIQGMDRVGTLALDLIGALLLLILIVQFVSSIW